MYKKIIPYMFIFLLCLTVVFAGDNSLTLNYYDENGNSVSNVAVWVFECTDRSCEELTGTLTSDLIDYDDSRSSNSVTITIPKETDSSTYYVAYAFAENTDQYLPHAYEGFAFSSGGDGEANVDLTLEKKEDCKSEIRSLSVYNVEEPYMPVTVDVEAGIDADTYSAFLLNDEVYPWGYDQNADAMTWYQDWYSSEVEVEMKVSKKWGGSEVYITQDTQTEDLNILAGESEEVSFTWTPTTTGEYRVVVTTTVTDDQCSSSEEDQASDYFTIVEAEDTSYCYTELQNLDVYDDDGNVVLTAQTGETYTVAFEKVSNSVDSDGNLEALETELEGTVFNEDGNVDYSFADTADANADTTNYETYSFEWTPVSEGENTITVNGIAADCPYSDNLDESLDITVDVEGEDIPTTDYEPSIISCDADPNPAYVGEDVQFDSTLSLLTRLRIWLFGYEVEYSWDFDDSETSSDEEPAHAYDSTGTYTATVTVTDSDGDYDTCSVDVEVIENEEPTVSCDFSGTTGTVGEELTLGVTASDSDGTIEQYDWDFGDGNVETSDAETTHNYESADTYTVTVEVTDNDGDTGSCSGTVEITEPENVEPTVSCDFSGTTGTVGEELTLEVTASDSDGTIEQYDWDFGDGNVDSTADDETTHTYEIADTYSVYVEATDDDGDSASCSGTVTIEEEEESTEPTISCDLFPSEGSVDEELTLTLDVTDEDSVIAMFGWDFGDGDIDSTTDTETNHAYGSEDTFTVQVTAYDSDGNEAASCSTDIEITEEIETNQAPEVDCSMMPTTGVVDQEIELEVEATDSDGEIVEYYWTFGDGEDDTTTVDLTSHIYTSADAFTIGILVTDDDGDTGFCQQDIIIADDLPAIAVASADPTEGEAILKVKFSSEGSSGNEPLSYKWSFGDGSGTSTQANPVHYYDEEGVYVAVLLVTDADGDTDTDSVTITVGDEVANNAQNHYYIDGLAVGNDGIVNAGDTLELYVSTENIADMDKDKVTINAIMQEIGVYATSGEFDLDEDDTESVVLYLDIPADTEPGTYYVRVTVSDDDVKRVIYRDIIVTA